MIQCPGCRSAHPTNTLYCTECGLYLGKGIPTGNLGIQAAEGNPAKAPETERGSPMLTLQFDDIQHEVTLALTKELLFGRPDASTGLRPDLDLTPFNGLDRGVSRRHLRMTRFENEVVVEDLGSANGTFCNGQQLTPYRGHPIRDGDELRLGRLAIRVRISMPTKQ